MPGTVLFHTQLLCRVDVTVAFLPSYRKHNMACCPPTAHGYLAADYVAEGTEIKIEGDVVLYIVGTPTAVSIALMESSCIKDSQNCFKPLAA